MEPTHIKPDIWYKVDDDCREAFIKDIYAAYINLCNERENTYQQNIGFDITCVVTVQPGGMT